LKQFQKKKKKIIHDTRIRIRIRIRFSIL